LQQQQLLLLLPPPPLLLLLIIIIIDNNFSDESNDESHQKVQANTRLKSEKGNAVLQDSDLNWKEKHSRAEELWPEDISLL
jgi:hypothetical protein